MLGRAYRSADNKAMKLSPPVEWVPPPDPDLIYSGAQHFRADFKSSSYRRTVGTASWTINAGTHERCDVDGYITADLADNGTVHARWYPKGAVKATGDPMGRDSKANVRSVFLRCFLPPMPGHTAV